jgi:5-methylcytosine-specific restriction endonuclease McrA
MKARNNYLRVNHECLGCKAVGLSIAADVVDHIIPHSGDQSLFRNPSNWQPACYWHHSSVKAALENLWRARKIQTEALHLDSQAAIQITRANLHRRVKPTIGPDGYPIPERST